MFPSSTPNFISKPLKYCLFAFNLFYWCLSGMMLGLGFWAITQKSSHSELTDIGVADPAIVLIVIGFIMFFISFFGTVGALRENTTFLYIYLVVMIIIVITEILCGLITFAFWPQVKGPLDTKITNMITKYRDDPDLENLIDGVQEQLKCCGARDYNDWESNKYFACDSLSFEKCGVPWSCCVRDADDKINYQCGYQARDVPHRLALQGKIYIVGCTDQLIQYFSDNLITVAAVLVAFSLPQIIGIVMCWVFIKQIKRQIEEWNATQQATLKRQPKSSAFI